MHDIITTISDDIKQKIIENHEKETAYHQQFDKNEKPILEFLKKPVYAYYYDDIPAYIIIAFAKVKSDKFGTHWLGLSSIDNFNKIDHVFLGDGSYKLKSKDLKKLDCVLEAMKIIDKWEDN